jgi:hypothetical protein
MIISIINHSNGKVSDAKVQQVIRAINRQMAEDFEPYWSITCRVRLEGRSSKKPSDLSLADMRGDAVIYIWDKHDIDDAVGYHEKNNMGVPYGFVFLDIAEELEEEWSVILSHETLELAADPEVNLLVVGPHPDPSENRRNVFFWYEMCDAVQGETYVIDGVTVSNFVLPLYFTSGDEYTGRNDFLGSQYGKKNATLRSFGVNPGGYVGFYDPKRNKHITYHGPEDKEATRRMNVKKKIKGARRAVRYQRQS